MFDVVNSLSVIISLSYVYRLEMNKINSRYWPFKCAQENRIFCRNVVFICHIRQSYSVWNHEFHCSILTEIQEKDTKQKRKRLFWSHFSWPENGDVASFWAIHGRLMKLKTQDSSNTKNTFSKILIIVRFTNLYDADFTCIVTITYVL